MSYKQLTISGKEYIRKIITSNGDMCFTGKNSYAVPYTDIPIGTIITSKAYDDNYIQTTDVSKFSGLVIKWTEQYCKEYGLDANVLSAQQFSESAFIPWQYSNTGAMGMTQFTVTTVCDWIFNRAFNQFTTEEINRLIVGLESTVDYKKPSSYLASSKQSEVYNNIRKSNRSILYQNIIDNPKIMIKAQASYMSFISDRNNKLASSSLFAYNRGGSLTSTDYADAITTMVNGRQNPYFKKFGKKWTFEGLNYVNNIFRLLNKEYGYNLDLTINETVTKQIGMSTSAS